MVLPGTLPAAPRPAAEAEPVTERWKWRLGIGVAVAGAVILMKLVLGGLSGLSGGSYEFLETQGGDPVTWNHCRAIRYQVNPKGAPEEWQAIVGRAVQDIEDASGFVFMDAGTTTKNRLIGQRYAGNEWEPVLILWSDRYQNQSLDGSIVGRGGSAPIEVNGRLRYVIGQVAMDSTLEDPFATRMVLEHELGHVLGLDHSTDSGQVMYAGYHGQERLGDGDIEGLQRLHEVPCG